MNNLIPMNVARYVASGRRHWHLMDQGEACLGAYRLKKDAILLRDKLHGGPLLPPHRPS